MSKLKRKEYVPMFVQYNAFSSVVKELFMCMKKFTDISVEYGQTKSSWKDWKKGTRIQRS